MAEVHGLQEPLVVVLMPLFVGPFEGHLEPQDFYAVWLLRDDDVPEKLQALQMERRVLASVYGLLVRVVLALRRLLWELVVALVLLALFPMLAPLPAEVLQAKA